MGARGAGELEFKVSSSGRRRWGVDVTATSLGVAKTEMRSTVQDADYFLVS